MVQIICKVSADPDKCTPIFYVLLEQKELLEQ